MRDETRPLGTQLKEMGGGGLYEQRGGLRVKQEAEGSRVCEAGGSRPAQLLSLGGWGDQRAVTQHPVGVMLMLNTHHEL